jgi:hypothetical protein
MTHTAQVKKRKINWTLPKLKTFVPQRTSSKTEKKTHRIEEFS